MSPRAKGRPVAPASVTSGAEAPSSGAAPEGAGPPLANDAHRDALELVRAQIESVDHAMIGLLGDRLLLARAAGEAKRAVGLPSLDPAREAAVVRHAASEARDQGLPVEPIRDVFWHIIALCRSVQAPGE